MANGDKKLREGRYQVVNSSMKSQREVQYSLWAKL